MYEDVHKWSESMMKQSNELHDIREELQRLQQENERLRNDSVEKNFINEISRLKESYKQENDENQRYYKNIIDEERSQKEELAAKVEELESQKNNLIEETEQLKQRVQAAESDLQEQKVVAEEAQTKLSKQQETIRLQTLLNIVRKTVESFRIAGQICYYANRDDDKDTLQDMQEVLNGFINAFVSSGAENIGKIGQTIPFEPSMHDSCDEPIKTGAPVRIIVPGWKVSNVIVKAIVEKMGE